MSADSWPRREKNRGALSPDSSASDKEAPDEISPQDLGQLLGAVADGSMSPEEAEQRLASLTFADLGFAKLDVHRELRAGQPEAIFGAGKTDEELLAIAEKFVEASGRLLATRIDAERGAKLLERFPSGSYEERARVFSVGCRTLERSRSISVLSAGTSDLGVAEEVSVCAEWLGHRVERVYDVGVAGLQRLLAELPRLRQAELIVVVAGMDGALPTVVAGLLPCPVIAVPTSVGYGAAFDGLAALLTMLNGCAPGVAVVNIDNGFGAAMMASRIVES